MTAWILKSSDNAPDESGRRNRKIGETERFHPTKRLRKWEMLNRSKSPALWAAFAAVLLNSATAQTRNEGAFSRLALDFPRNGQHVTAIVGEQIELTLGLAGPAHYGVPEISSSAIRLEDTALDFPIRPGGVSFTYMLEAIAQGEAEIRIPILDALGPGTPGIREFSMTVHVAPGAGIPSPYANLRRDTENRGPWQGRWANPAISPNKRFASMLSETFVPSLGNLTAVEVELVAAHPGPPATGDIEIQLSSNTSKPVADVWKTVSTEDCSHVLFLLPKGGVQVSRGNVYTLRLTEFDGLFGWKYVVGGYRKGAASAPDGSIPPLPDARSTFLLKTFGTK
jgi:hypothetical protein